MYGKAMYGKLGGRNSLRAASDDIEISTEKIHVSRRKSPARGRDLLIIGGINKFLIGLIPIIKAHTNFLFLSDDYAQSKSRDNLEYCHVDYWDVCF
jgi:hypothetical protein